MKKLNLIKIVYLLNLRKFHVKLSLKKKKHFLANLKLNVLIFLKQAVLFLLMVLSNNSLKRILNVKLKS